MHNECDQILRLWANDKRGIVACISEQVASEGGDIRDAVSYGDDKTGNFFMRMHMRFDNVIHVNAFEQKLQGCAHNIGFKYRLHDWHRRPRLLIAVSKFDHCLVDLLHRWKTGSLKADIVGIVSNHEDARAIVEWHGIPFYYLPVTKESKVEQEKQILQLIKELNINLVVLARYMQILSEDMCRALSGRCINIHHSFFPSFKGAKPYHRAHERGVKLIGATAHYVTTDLDEGPIIEQDVRRVSHSTSVEEMIAIGREVEASVLARAVQWHIEQRVLINGHKTVVFYP